MKDIYEGISPIILFTRITGVLNLEIKDRFGKKCMLPGKYPTHMLVPVVYLSIIGYDLYNQRIILKHSNYVTGVLLVGVVITSGSNVLASCVVCLTNRLKKWHIIGVFKQIAAVDEDYIMIHDYSESSNYQLINIYLSFAYFFWQVLQLIIINSKHTVINIETFFIIAFPTIFRFINECFYVNIVKIIFIKAKILNEALTSLFDDSLGKQKGNILFVEGYGKEHESKLDKLENLMNIYNKLIKIITCINKTFSIQIFATINNLFFNILFLSFNSYHEFKIQKRYISSLSWMGGSILVGVEIIWIMTTCHLTTKQLHHTGSIIHKILGMKEITTDLWTKLMIFSQQVKISNSKILAMGVIELNAALIFTFISGTSTYQLIMIQYEEGVRSQCLNLTIT